jgi:hypothetical protein
LQCQEGVILIWGIGEFLVICNGFWRVASFTAACAAEDGRASTEACGARNQRIGVEERRNRQRGTSHPRAHYSCTLKEVPEHEDNLHSREARCEVTRGS